jgi:hypothetical protein
VTVKIVRITFLLVIDLGVSSPDWWHEAVETKETSNTFADKGDSDCTSEVCGCRSPVFKTPQVGLKSKRNRKSCDRLLALSRHRGSRGESFTQFHGFKLSCMNYISTKKKIGQDGVPPFLLWV